MYAENELKDLSITTFVVEWRTIPFRETVISIK